MQEYQNKIIFKDGKEVIISGEMVVKGYLESKIIYGNFRFTVKKPVKRIEIINNYRIIYGIINKSNDNIINDVITNSTIELKNCIVNNFNVIEKNNDFIKINLDKIGTLTVNKGANISSIETCTQINKIINNGRINFITNNFDVDSLNMEESFLGEDTEILEDFYVFDKKGKILFKKNSEYNDLMVEINSLMYNVEYKDYMRSSNRDAYTLAKYLSAYKLLCSKESSNIVDFFKHKYHLECRYIRRSINKTIKNLENMLEDCEIIKL
jgi:hypothetical protein